MLLSVSVIITLNTVITNITFVLVCEIRVKMFYTCGPNEAMVVSGKISTFQYPKYVKCKDYILFMSWVIFSYLAITCGKIEQ